MRSRLSLLTFLIFYWGLGFFLPNQADATAIANSSLSFSNLLISPQNGTLEFLDIWYLEAYAEACNSLGELASDFDFSLGDKANADAQVTYADGHGAVASPSLLPDLNVSGIASSNVNIPGETIAAAESLGRGSAYTLFSIKRDLDPKPTVNVDFSIDLTGLMNVFTDEYGLYAKTETIFGMELNGSPILFFRIPPAILSIGPNDSDYEPISKNLMTTMSLEYDVPYFLYLEVDSESRAANVPEPSTFILLLVGLGGACICLRKKNTRGIQRTTGLYSILFFLSLIGFLVTFLPVPVQASYIGGGSRCEECENKKGPSNKESGGSSLSLTEGNLQELYDVVSVQSSIGSSINLSLTYNSFDADSSWSKIDTVMGYGWTHSFNIFLFSQRGHMFRMDGSGRVNKYQLGAGGTFTSTTGYFETLVRNADGTFTLTDENGTVFNFALIPDTPFMVGGPVYRLTGVTDRNNNTTTLTYAGGLLTTITDAFGRNLTFSYNRLKKIETITDPLGRTTILTYDATGRKLLKISDPKNYSRQYTYNLLYQITKKIDKDGRIFTYIYQNGKPVEIRDGAGKSIFNPQNWATDPLALAYSLLREYIPATSTKTDGRGNLWKYEYNKHGYVTKMITPGGATSIYTYDPITLNVATETDANGNINRYEYDAHGNRSKITDCQGNVTEYTYELVFNNPTSMTDPNTRVTTWEYDANGNRIKETDPAGNVQKWTYDANGNLLTETDKNGNVTAHEYDVFGNRTKTTDALDNVTTMTYDLVGNLLTRTDALGRVSTMVYDDLDRLIQETDPLGYVIQYVHDGEGNRIQVTDANGNTTTYEYDLRTRLIKTTDALGHVETQTYNGNNNRVSFTDKNGHTTKFEYDVQNRLVKITDALGNATTMTYDPVGNKITETDANGHITRYEYDCLNRLVRKIDANGCVTEFEYDTVNGPGCSTCSGPTSGSSLVTKQIDGNGKVTYFKYDALNRLVKQIRKEGDVTDVIDASDAVTEYTYDANGNRLSITEPNGNPTTYVYDALNRVTIETNAAGESILTTYDAVGNVKTVTAPNGNITTNFYDALDRVTQVNDSVGLVATYSYDPAGNRLTEADGNGNTTSYVYDAIYRLIRVIDPMGNPTTYTYDPVGNLLSVTDREGNVTTHEYDPLNRRIKTTDALGCVTTYEFDPVGNLLRIVDANGNATRYDYDAVHRLIREIYADGGVRTFTYDCVGNLLTRTDQNNRTTIYTYNDLYFLTLRDYPSDADDTFTYDLSGRMESADKGGWVVTFNYDGANRVTQTVQNGQTVSYAYDIPNNKRTLTYPGGLVIEEQMDLRARLQQVNDLSSPPPVAEYTYDLGNRVLTRSYLNDTVATYSYNPNNWITQLTHTAGINLIAGFTYDYDKEGNKQYEGKQHDTTRSEAYQYDDIYRLIDYKVGTLSGSTVPIPVTQTAYDLDCLGNWNSKTTDGTTQNRNHNMVNELTAIDGVPLNYDDNGNLIEDERYTYVYDEENRLTRVIRKGSIPEDDLVVGQYQYDALGRRIIKKFSPDGPIIETRYFYDDTRVIEEQDHATTTLAEYIYGNYIDEVLVMRRAGQLYFYHQNALWSVAAITDRAINVVERYAYDAYGHPTITDGTGLPVPPNAWGTAHSAIDNPYLFTGRRLDEETGLYYYRARYYDSLKGRFITKDPLGWLSGLNAFVYVDDRPTVLLDPYGLFLVKSLPVPNGWDDLGLWYWENDARQSVVHDDESKKYIDRLIYTWESTLVVTKSTKAEAEVSVSGDYQGLAGKSSFTISHAVEVGSKASVTMQFTLQVLSVRTSYHYRNFRIIEKCCESIFAANYGVKCPTGYKLFTSNVGDNNSRCYKYPRRKCISHDWLLGRQTGEDWAPIGSTTNTQKWKVKEQDTTSISQKEILKMQGHRYRVDVEGRF